MLHKKYLVLGGSKGLGAQLVKMLPGALSLSRSSESDFKLDLTADGAVKTVLRIVDENKIESVIYAAGGGPHGNFFNKPWHSHDWAFKVNALSPLNLIIELSKAVEFIYIGSAIAERSKSIDSLSYSLSKKMVKEVLLKNPDKNRLIFSPPYMDTGLLPKGAWPRMKCPELVLNPELVAKELMAWLKDKKPDDRCFDWMKRFNYSLLNDFEI